MQSSFAEAAYDHTMGGDGGGGGGLGGLGCGSRGGGGGGGYGGRGGGGVLLLDITPVWPRSDAELDLNVVKSAIDGIMRLSQASAVMSWCCGYSVNWATLRVVLLDCLW